MSRITTLGELIEAIKSVEAIEKQLEGRLSDERYQYLTNKLDELLNKEIGVGNEEEKE